MKQGNKPITTTELINHVRDCLADKFSLNSEDIVLNNFMRLLLADVINIYSDPGNYTIKVSQQPMASAYARYQATGNNWVTNQRSEKINIDLFTRVLLQYLDGENDTKIIHKKILKHFENNELHINEGGQQIFDGKEIRRRLKPVIDRTLKNLAKNAILVS